MQYTAPLQMGQRRSSTGEIRKDAPRAFKSARKARESYQRVRGITATRPLPLLTTTQRSKALVWSTSRPRTGGDGSPLLSRTIRELQVGQHDYCVARRPPPRVYAHFTKARARQHIVSPASPRTSVVAGSTTTGRKMVASLPVLALLACDG
jgi:hypothetical protein